MLLRPHLARRSSTLDRSRFRTPALAIVAMVALVPACSESDGASEAPSNPLVGAWTLTSWHSTAEDGTVTNPYGENPAGQIVYTASGRMSAQLMRPGAELPETTDAGVTAESMSAAILGRFFSYYGAYTIDDEANVVTHHVEGALLPSWIGSTRPRAFTFDGPDRVVLDTTPDEGRTNGSVSELVWERVTAQRDR